MSENTPLSTILSDEPHAEAPEAAVEAPQEAETPVEASEAPAETVERPRGPDGKFIPKGDKPEAEEPSAEAPPAPQQEEAGHIPIAALKDERSKRQALENELAQLRQSMAQAQQPQPIQNQGPPDRWEDPEGYDRWLVNQASVVAREEAVQAFNLQRIHSSAAQFRADKPDYDEAIHVFGQMADMNPGLVQQMQQADNPAAFAYETGKLQSEIIRHGSLQGYIAAQVEAQKAQALQAVTSQLPTSAPPSISSDRSVGGRSGPAWAGPTPLSDILS